MRQEISPAALPKDRPGWVAAAYLLLSCVYLIYLPHAEFVLDDWAALARYEHAREGGPRAQLQVAIDLLRNQFHHQFRFQWLSLWIGYALYLAAGYASGLSFAVILVVHAASAMALRQILERLGIGSGPAFLAGAFFVLWPAAHGPLFWNYICGFFVWANFWFLLYLRSLTCSLMRNSFDGRAAARQASLLALALFSGDPVFGLSLAAAPVTAWCAGASFRRRGAGRRAVLLAWGTVAAAAGSYALWINRAPVLQLGVGLRYEFSLANLQSNLATIYGTHRRLSGLGEEAFYQLRATGPALLAAAVAVGVVVVFLAGRRDAAPARRRAWLLAAALWAAAYGPIWFILYPQFRHDYVPSPWAALAAALAVCALPKLRLAIAAALAAGLAVAAVANIEQGWIPMSRHARDLAAALRRGRHQSGDLIIVSGAPTWIGTAPHFALHASWSSSPFAERATRVHGLEAAAEIVDEAGRLRVFHRNYRRDLQPAECARTRILLVDKHRRLSERHLLAQQTGPDAFRVFALRGYAGPPPSPQPVSREQLRLLEGTVYFAERLPGRS